MKNSDSAYFKKINPSFEHIHQIFKNALRDLEIAKEDRFREVRFNYAYQALLKGGIALLAKVDKTKVKSLPGHHVKILQQMSRILKNPDIFTVGNAMRMKRNLDLYEGGTLLGEKEIKDYLEFVETTMKEIKKRLS